jgi:hypothetical protein
MFKNSHLGISILVLAIALVASAPALANNAHDLRLNYDMLLKGTPLGAGEYSIRWEGHSAKATVTLSKKKAVVATVEGQLVDRGKKYERNSILFDTNSDGTRIIREIRVAGSSQALVFND